MYNIFAGLHIAIQGPQEKLGDFAPRQFGRRYRATSQVPGVRRHYCCCMGTVQAIYFQNSSLNPNWICRELFCVGNVGVPMLGVSAPFDWNMVKVWGVRLVLFNTLNISTRSCAFSLSPHIFWFLNTEKSKSRNTGIRKMSRPKFPSTPSAGKAKHSVLM